MFVPRLKCGTYTDHRLTQRRKNIILRIGARPVSYGEQVCPAEKYSDMFDSAGLF
jgi:hypothetical protein